MAASTKNSPRIAFFEISAPHVGPTSFTLMSDVVIPACFARVFEQRLRRAVRRQRRRADRDLVAAVHELDLRHRLARSRPSSPGSGWPDGRDHRVLDQRAAGEVDRVVQAAPEQPDQRQHDQDAGEREPDVAVLRPA